MNREFLSANRYKLSNHVESLQTNLMLIAVILFIVGDLTTTIYALTEYPHMFHETNAIASLAIATYGLWSLVGLKLTVFSGFYAAYRYLPTPEKIGVPIGLILIGGFATISNILLILTV